MNQNYYQNTLQAQNFNKYYVSLSLDLPKTEIDT